MNYMKIYALILLLFGLINIQELFCQDSFNGKYVSLTQRFEDSNNPSKNKEHKQKVILEIDISEVTNKGILKITYPSDNIPMSYDLVSKFDTKFDEEKQTLFVSYKAYVNYEHERLDVIFYIYFIKDYKAKTLHLAITPENGKTSNWFHDLTKL